MERSTQAKGVALVGMSGRFPGASSLNEFWQNLTEGREAISLVSEEDLLAGGVSPELIASPDYVRAASTVHAPESFDAAFFGFSAREAEIIDPQQRVFLECAWEALEEAGCDPGVYPGAIGVFAGGGMNSYGAFNLMSRPDVVASVGSYQAILGNDKDFLCSRVAYKLNLRGPAVGVQTACSTSLVAVQMAFESLLRKECDVALAGGVSIPLPQGLGYLYVPGMILSRDGHCRAFDASSSGTVPGAGAGVVVLKRVEDALEDGDHIYAVIRGAAINNDGAAKVGYSAPSVDGQHAVIRKSMEMAGFEAASVKYVEAHGTGTEVGDPIEFTALARAFESAAQAPNTCALGSLKTNIGHLDTAAGVAGLIKATLSVKNRMIPPTLHFKNPNPLIDFAKSPFYVNSTLVQYNGEQPFRAGVSSFGIGGTNAHVSLEEAPANVSDPTNGTQLIVLSAKSATALDRRMAQLLQYLEETPDANLSDIAYTLQVGRQSFQFRQSLVASGVEHLKEQLGAGPQSAELRKLRSDDVMLDPSPVAFLFPGQGAQFVNMGRDLYEGVSLFRETVDYCAQTLRPYLGVDLRTVLYPSGGEEKQAEGLLNQTSFTQPALFTIEYAMARLWMQCGISPAAMIGHSVGEYVAACLAGVFSVEDALALVAERGRLIQSMPPGVMLAVSLSEQDLSPLLSSSVSIAGINSDKQTVASGPAEEIAKLEESLNRKNILCKRLRTSHAFHSPMMDPIVGTFVERVEKVKRNTPAIRYLSNVTGTWITAAQATDPAYWGAHLRQAVRFADCARNLLKDGDSLTLEVGPGETLASLIRAQAGPNNRQTIVPSMRHALAPANDRDVWLAAMGKLWLKNVRIDWKGLHAGERRVRVSLPTYPFDRQRYWVEPGKISTASAEPAIPLKKPDIADWFYVPSWKRMLLDPPRKNGNTNNWLMFVEDDALSQELAGKLDARGTVIEVRAGSRFRALPSNTYEVRPGNEDDCRALISELAANKMWPDRVVYLWKPEPPDCGLLAAIALVQAIEEVNPAAPVELNIIGDRAYSIFGEQISLIALGALNAFWRVVPIECSNLKLRVIDVDLNLNKELAGEQILLELQREAAQETVAYRGTGRWRQIYEPIRLESSEAQGSDSSLNLRPGGTYVITGGLGGVGLVLARHIARKTQGRIVLISRIPLPREDEWDSLIASSETDKGMTEKFNGIRLIRDAGGQVDTMHADVSDAAAMNDLMAEIRRRHGAVHGIIHAAGVAGSGLVQVKSQDQALAVLSAKVQGTEWLRGELRASELDFVMLCSSISAVLSHVGLSDYAAANAYLDGFAAECDDPKATRVLAVNWDTWRDVGMAVNTALPAALEAFREDRLKHAIRSNEAEEVFDRLLNYPLPQVVVSTRDLISLQRMEAAALQARALNTEVRMDQHEPSELEGAVESPASDDEIEGFIVGLWQELLGAKSVGIHDNFFQLGGHSLMGTQVLSRVRERFRVNLPLRSVFEAVTPAEFAQRIRVMRWAMNPAESESDVEREEIEI